MEITAIRLVVNVFFKATQNRWMHSKCQRAKNVHENSVYSGMHCIVTRISDLQMGFGLVNWFTEYSWVIATINYNTFKITVTITHKITSSTLQLFSCLLNSLPPMASQLWLHNSTWSTCTESCVMTNSQSASLSQNKAPTWGLRPDFYYCLTVKGFLMWGTVSDVRMGLSFTTAAGPRQRSHSWVWDPWDSRPNFTVSD
jgi:hypothetical protein